MAKTGDTGRFQVQLTGGMTKTVSGGGSPVKQALSKTITWSLIDGLGALGYNVIYTKSGTANSTPAAAIDLAGTSTDDFGDTSACTEALLILAENSGTTQPLIVGGESADIVSLGAGHSWLVPVGDGTNNGFCLMGAPGAGGMAVTATTADKISVATASSTTAYTIYVLARG